MGFDDQQKIDSIKLIAAQLHSLAADITKHPERVVDCNLEFECPAEEVVPPDGVSSIWRTFKPGGRQRITFTATMARTDGRDEKLSETLSESGNSDAAPTL